MLEKWIFFSVQSLLYLLSMSSSCNGPGTSRLNSSLKATHSLVMECFPENTGVFLSPLRKIIPLSEPFISQRCHVQALKELTRVLLYKMTKPPLFFCLYLKKQKLSTILFRCLHTLHSVTTIEQRNLIPSWHSSLYHPIIRM